MCLFVSVFPQAAATVPDNQAEKVPSVLEKLHKVNSLNDKSKAIGRICLKFHISVTSPNTKELPEDSSRPEGKQSTRHGCSLSLRLSRGPNATIVRPDFLCLAVADTGITLDLDKDGHSDFNQNQDADHRKTFSCHNSYIRLSQRVVLYDDPICRHI